ncbi:MAG: chloride channel protein, partial [bacterium]
MKSFKGPHQEPQHTRTEEQAPGGRHRLEWLRASLPTGTGFESARNLAKWLLLSTAIGLVAGIGAIAFYLAIQVATAGFLGRMVGYLPPGPLGEGTSRVLPMARPWLLPLVTALGGLLSGLIVSSLAPEAEGHGTDAAIAAIHHRGGRIRPRIPPIKLIASAITIGSGGSGGREGPAAQISAGFGSLLADWLRLDVRDRRMAVAAGMGAGIAAIFRAPLGGALLAAEILYLHDLEVEAIIPALIAGIVGYTTYGAYFGFGPIFGHHPGLSLGHPIQLFYYALLGVLSGLGGIAYARSFYGLTGVFHRLALPNWLKPALGGLAVGLLGLVLPQVLHMGYGWVQLAMTSHTLFQIPLWVLLVLPLAKILATSLSIGSGGSGGIFGPGMVIGGMLGAAFWRLTHGLLPHAPAQPAPFVIIGMMALFGGIAHAPLAVMLMVAEMTGNLSLLAPAMVAVAISTALVGDHTIYRSQLHDRASAPFHKVRLSFPMLSTLLVRDAMTEPPVTVQA